MSRRLTAFVLAGGGNLGAIQVGMLQALLEAEIEPDLIVGSSVGALNGAFLAERPTMDRVEALGQLWRNLRRRDIFPFRPARLASGLARRRSHFFDPDRFRSFLAGVNLGFGRLEAATVPLHVVATDLASGRPVVLSTGTVIDALVASAALPRFFPPVEVAGRYLIDGGVAADTPIAQAAALGATQIYVLPTFPNSAQPTPGQQTPGQPTPGQPSLLLKAARVVMGLRDGASSPQPQTAVPVHVLPVPAGPLPSMFDFTQTGVLMARGLAETRRWLARESARPWTPATRGPGRSPAPHRLQPAG